MVRVLKMEMPSGVYNNGSYVFLTGSSTSNVYTGRLAYHQVRLQPKQ